MTYDAKTLAILNAMPFKKMTHSEWIVNQQPDHLKSRQRAAVEKKRKAAQNRDLERFIRATAHLSDEVFCRTDGYLCLDLEIDHLFIGLGISRLILLNHIWKNELTRRSARTAHQIIEEQRLIKTSP